jgi:hypothetical protein
MKHRAFHRVFAAPFLTADPATGASKIDSERWSFFISDIKSESAKFKEILTQTAFDRRRINSEFVECARRSFNAVHSRTGRASDENSRADTRTASHHQQTSSMEAQRPEDDPLTEGPKPVPRESPAKAATAARYLAPERLTTVYDVQPKQRDTFAITGVPVCRDMPSWSALL